MNAVYTVSLDNPQQPVVVALTPDQIEASLQKLIPVNKWYLVVWVTLVELLEDSN